MSENPCLVPECGRNARTRGLCDRHYMYLCHKIKNGITTWDEVVKNGKALPRMNTRSGTQSSWLLDFKKDT